MAPDISPLPRLTAEPTSAFNVRHAYQAERAAESLLQAQLAYWTSAGWFDADQYRADGEQAQAWLQLLHEAVAAGTCLTVVLMPESSTLHDLVPPPAAAMLLQLQAQAAPRARVLNLRTSLPKDRIHDYAHLNPCGCADFSAELPAMLAASPGGCPGARDR